LDAFERERQFMNGGAIAASKPNDNKVAHKVVNGPLLMDAYPVTPVRLSQVLNAIGVPNKQQ
jgi:hypothetical protein